MGEDGVWKQDAPHQVAEKLAPRAKLDEKLQLLHLIEEFRFWKEQRDDDS